MAISIAENKNNVCKSTALELSESLVKKHLCNSIPGINAERIFELFQKDNRLWGFPEYISYEQRKHKYLDLMQISQSYADHIRSLYLDNPRLFFCREEYLQAYLMERMKHFGIYAEQQVYRKHNYWGCCTADIFCPDEGFLIELKSSFYKRNSFCVSLQIEKYQEVFDAPCLLVYAEQIHDFEKALFVDKIPVKKLLERF